MLGTYILTVGSVIFCTAAGYLHGVKKGYSSGKRAGYFRAHTEKVSQ